MVKWMNKAPYSNLKEDFDAMGSTLRYFVLPDYLARSGASNQPAPVGCLALSHRVP